MTKFSMKDVAERRAIARSIVEPQLKAKRDAKVLNLYEKQIVPGSDGRSHTSLSPIGTSTFRLSSSGSLLFPDSSTNWQNQPQKIARLDALYRVRDCVIPDDGMVLVAGDYKGAEAVLCAAYAQDWDWLKKLLNGADTHTEHAQYFFGDPHTDPNVRRMQRDLAKIITYLSLYSGSAHTATEKINKDADVTGVRVTIEQVHAAQSILYQLHPLERWWASVRTLLDESGGVLRNCFGYRRVFRDPDDDYRLKDGLAFYPQSTVGWLMNESIVHLVDEDTNAARTKTFHAEWLLQIHDELLWQCAPRDVLKLISFCRKPMERRFSIHGRELYVPVEFKTGPTWGSLQEVKVP